ASHSVVNAIRDRRRHHDVVARDTAVSLRIARSVDSLRANHEANTPWGERLLQAPRPARASCKPVQRRADRRQPTMSRASRPGRSCATAAVTSPLVSAEGAGGGAIAAVVPLIEML